MSRPERTTIVFYSSSTIFVNIICCVLLFLGDAVASNRNAYASKKAVQHRIEAYDIAVIVNRGYRHAHLFKGLLVSRKACCRIAFYWMDPLIISDEMDELACSDMIYSDGVLSCCLYGVRNEKQYFHFDLNKHKSRFHLPEQEDLQEMLQSTVSVLGQTSADSISEDEALEMGRFFKYSRNQDKFTYFTKPDSSLRSLFDPNMSRNEPINLADLPFFRIYQKQKRADGSMNWRIQDAWTREDVVSLTITPNSTLQEEELMCAFDLATLGKWSGISEPYRQYWALRNSVKELLRSNSSIAAADNLFTDIDSRLRQELPEEVSVALNKLWFRVALKTERLDNISRSACAYVASYKQESQRYSVKVLIDEIGWIVDRINKQCSNEETYPIVYSILKRFMDDEAFSDSRFVKQSIDKLMHQGSFWYGQLLIDALREHDCVSKDVLDQCANELNTWRLSKHVEKVDVNMLTPSEKELINHLRSAPPRGKLTLADLRVILNQGFPLRFAKASDEKEQFIDSLLSSVNLIAGEGPFCADKDKLADALIRFDRQYHPSQVPSKDVHTLLTTFLALSFYDTSTEQDKIILRSQLCQASKAIEEQTLEITKCYNLTAIVHPDEINKLFAKSLQEVITYIEDPLFPMFKYRLTKNEHTRLTNLIKISLGQFKETAAKYSEMLLEDEDHGKIRRRLLYSINNLSSQLAYRMASIRRPRIPGMTCGNGADRQIYIKISRDMYDRDEQAQKEAFKKMAYFYIGHRINCDM